ncbi:unnamed protein product [Penicillium roqueforti FM164]|uniref:Genomic scaffold, ProqFM164S03 n=1 Tax=Penicillium roqueforti (strain FM164) TaxID=1365484 RepID=W6QAZ8_PENRF|nr:unnamed protein product [Penicillium roqueforti FM164]
METWPDQSPAPIRGESHRATQSGQGGPIRQWARFLAPYGIHHRYGSSSPGNVPDSGYGGQDMIMCGPCGQASVAFQAFGQAVQAGGFRRVVFFSGGIGPLDGSLPS